MSHLGMWKERRVHHGQLRAGPGSHLSSHTQAAPDSKNALGGHFEGSDVQKRKFPPRPKRLMPSYFCVPWSHGPKLAPGLQKETQRQKILLAKVVRAGISTCAVHHPDTPAGPRHSLVLPAGGTPKCWWFTAEPLARHCLQLEGADSPSWICDNHKIFKAPSSQHLFHSCVCRPAESHARPLIALFHGHIVAFTHKHQPWRVKSLSIIKLWCREVPGTSSGESAKTCSKQDTCRKV